MLKVRPSQPSSTNHNLAHAELQHEVRTEAAGVEAAFRVELAELLQRGGREQVYGAKVEKAPSETSVTPLPKAMESFSPQSPASPVITSPFGKVIRSREGSSYGYPVRLVRKPKKPTQPALLAF